jgi:hypothetical protein
MSEGKVRKFNSGKAWSFLANHTCADNTDTTYQKKYRAFIPNGTGVLNVRFTAGGSPVPIYVTAGDIYDILDIYSFDATGSTATVVTILA